MSDIFLSDKPDPGPGHAPPRQDGEGFSILQHYRETIRRLKAGIRSWLFDDVDSVSQSLGLPESRLPRVLTLTIVFLCLTAVIFFAWAAVTPVKELVRAEGQVLPAGYSQLVQHLEGGLVREIFVHEGDFVRKDQLLVQLDGAGLEEDFHEQEAMVQSLSLQAERLQALLDGRAPDFTHFNATPAQIAEQTRIWQTGRDAETSELAVIDAQIAEKSKNIGRLRQSLTTAGSNLNVAQENARIFGDLESKGLTAHTAYLKKAEELNSRQGDVDTTNGQIESARRELGEYQRRREALLAQQRDTSYTELNKVRSQLAQAGQSLKKRKDRVDRLTIRAPVMGYVKGLRVNTIGSVIPAGQTLMEIVPAGEQLIVEARILPGQVGRVAVGQETQVRIDSYDYVRFGTIPGTLDAISAMTFTDEARHQDFYKGRVRLDKNYAGPNPGEHLILPGMSADADIVVGEKTVLGYLLKPIQSALRNALTEQ